MAEPKGTVELVLRMVQVCCAGLAIILISGLTVIGPVLVFMKHFSEGFAPPQPSQSTAMDTALSVFVFGGPTLLAITAYLINLYTRVIRREFAALVLGGLFIVNIAIIAFLSSIK